MKAAVGNVTANEGAYRQDLASVHVRLALLEEASTALKDRMHQKDGSTAILQADLKRLAEQQAALTPKAIFSHPSVQKLLDQKVILSYVLK